MKNLVLTTGAGDNFTRVADRAKVWATEQNRNVEFEFNGIKCLVSKDTNLEWLYRDYSNSWTMKWKEVGPDCVKDYPLEVASELARLELEQERADNERMRLAKIEEENEKATFEKKVSGIEIEFSNHEDYIKGKEKNTDPYGACIYVYAEGWAKLMQREIAKGKTVAQCAEKTSHELGFLGITGFMYGAAVSILSHCWKYGEELRKWHNKDYGHEGEGVVNPAILTIKS